MHQRAMASVLIAIGLALGLVLGVLGGGGSILTVPALVYTAGIAPKTAIAMSLAVVGSTSAVGAVMQWRAGRVHIGTALTFGVATMIGALGGARLATLMRGDVQLVLLAVVMLAAAGAMLRTANGTAAPEKPARPLLLGLTGLGVGVLTGIVGIGGGFLIVPALTLLASLSMAEAVGTSLAVITMNSAAGFAGTVRHVSIPWGSTAYVTAAAVTGILAGTAIGGRLKATHLKRGFALFLLTLAVFVLYTNRGVFISLDAGHRGTR